MANAPIRDGNDVRLKEWQLGYAVCAVTGELLAVVDVDPRNGGDVEAVCALLAVLNVTVYAEVATPGGGVPLLRHGHRDLPTCHDLIDLPGVDVQSHGAHVFLPGTSRPKYDGGSHTSSSTTWWHWPMVATRMVPRRSRTGWPHIVPLGPVSRSRRTPWDGGPPDLVSRLPGQGAGEPAGRGRHGGPRHQERRALHGCPECGSFIAGAGLDEAEVVGTLYDAASRVGLLAEDGEAVGVGVDQLGPAQREGAPACGA